MDPSARSALASTSHSGKDKKLREVMEHREEFAARRAKVEAAMGDAKELRSPEAIKADASGDMCVCVRARPLLRHELDAEYFDCVSCVNPKVSAMEPRLDVRGMPRPNVTEYEVRLKNGFI